MGIDSELSNLIGGAYEAAVDPAQWDGWAWKFCELLGGTGVSVNLLDRARQSLAYQSAQHKEMERVERYVRDEMFRVDPQVAYASVSATNRVYCDYDHVDPSDPATAEWLSWHKSNFRLHHYVTAAFAIADSGLQGAVSIHRHAGGDAYEKEERRIARHVLPHLNRAMTLGFRHAEKLNAHYWSGVLDGQREPAALLGPDGSLLEATDTFMNFVTAGDGLACQGERLGCLDPVSQERWQQLLWRAGHPYRPGAGSCAVVRASGKSPLVLNAFPLRWRVQHLLPRNTVILVTLVDPSRRPSTSPDRWRDAFGLTARESECADLLVAGHSPESAAAVMEVSTATVRLHMHRIFRKTRTSRQAELVWLLSRI